MKNSSYWHEQIIFVQPAEIKKTYDAIIIGGGIAGLSTAYWLEKENPHLKIAIIEKNTLGYGASGRNAGFVTCGSLEHFMKLEKQFGLDKATEIWKFSEENRKLLLEHIIQDQELAVDFRPTGSATVAPNAESWEVYKKTAKTMKAQGIDVFEIGHEELEKDYGVTGFDGAIQYTGDGYVHPIKLLNLLKQKTKCDVIENTEVLEMTDYNKTVQIKTSKGNFNADQVYVTVNAYLPLIAEEFKSLITPARGQILVTKPLPDFVKGPCYLTKHLCYFRQLPTGHLLIGGFRNLSVETETTFDDQTTPLIQNALLDFVRSHFKLGVQAEVANQWSGVMGMSKDGQMMIGNHPKMPRVHIMAGCSGHGMGLSFNAAKTLVESSQGRRPPTHLRLERFFKS